MKKIFFLLFTSILLISCDDELIVDSTDCFEVKLIDQMCGNAILQIVDASFTGVDKTNWTDGDGTTFERVFSANLPCNANQEHFEKGAVFQIRIVDQPIDETCGRCAAILPSMPEVRNEIEIMDGNCNSL